MKKAGIVILVLGILGLGVGVFGLISEQSARGTIEEKQALLSETVPELTDVADLNDVADLVSIERMLSGDPSHPPEVQSAATDILDAMGDEQDMVTVKLGGLAGVSSRCSADCSSCWVASGAVRTPPRSDRRAPRTRGCRPESRTHFRSREP